ncbi:MAG: hypothetical protein K2J02_00115 [Malacoplasma sp.]|nr:hypothetical protein [Malacoplasma sp.]
MNNIDKKLLFKLDYLPIGSHYNNLRYFFKKEVWQVIVANVREFKNYQCEFCKKQFNFENSKSLKYLHCHELWNFNYEKKWQILKDLLLLCHNCHNCQHINFAHLKDKQDQTFNHFKKVNNLTDAEFNELKTNNLLFRKNYEDKKVISRDELDKVDVWFFNMDFNLESIFVNKTNARKIQKFLEQISQIN